MSDASESEVASRVIWNVRRLVAGGELAGALRAIDDATLQSPAILTMRAFVLTRLGDRPAALIAARAAVQAYPSNRDAHLMLAGLLLDGEDITQAGLSIRRGLVANPGCASLWRMFSATMRRDDGSSRDLRIATLWHAFCASPEDGRNRKALAAHLAECSARARFAGDAAEAIGFSNRAIEVDASHEGAWAAGMYAHQCREDLTPDEAYTYAVSAGRAIARAAPSVERPDGRASTGPLSLAILAARLDVSSVWFFLAPLLDRHDPSALSITLYDDAPERLRIDRDRVRTVALAGLAPDAVAERIASGGHDVVFDVMGYGQYGSRLSALAARPARYAMTGIGYPGTLGLDAVDWKISDAVVHPSGSHERLHEQPLRLPHMLCYQPPAYAPALAERRPGQPITFGSFNQLNKIGPSCLEAWRLTLAAVPDALLVVKRQEIAGREALFGDRFAAHGLPMDRVRLEAGETEHASHLARYAEIDIALDTFPYNGTTTTCESLWMGVPVVSLIGDRESSRSGLSLLTAAGMQENAVFSPSAFAERARVIAEDAAGLAEFRRGARRRLRNTALLDEAGYARSFEAALISAVGDRQGSVATALPTGTISG